MSSRVIVLIADPADPKYGEVTVVDSTAEAERLVETFLEAGYDRERIRVFAGAEMEAQISQRPKVDLVEQEPDRPAPSDGSPEAKEIEPVAAIAEEDAERFGARNEEQAQFAHAVSGADGEGLEKAQSGGSSGFSRLPEKPTELMPELLH